MIIKKTILVLFLFVILYKKTFSQTPTTPNQLHFTSKGITRVSVDSIYYYRFAAFDSSNKSFSFSVENLPSWLTYNSSDNSISGRATKAGQYYVHITATAPDTSIYQRFMLTVYNSETLNILPLGNSVTNGTDKYNSYRRALWQMLHQDNYNFDFIGSWSSHHMGGEVPDPDFDMDHEGHSGWTAHDMISPPVWDNQRGNINEWIQNYKPDIVLLELGTNEVFQCVPVKDALKNISSVIDIIRNKNPHVKIFLAQIPPLGKQWADKKLCKNDTAYSEAVKQFNKEIVTFASSKNTNISQTIIVDQYSGVNTSVDMYDDIHPNDPGEKIMAQRWYDAIRPYLKKLKD